MNKSKLNNWFIRASKRRFFEDVDIYMWSSGLCYGTGRCDEKHLKIPLCAGDVCGSGSGCGIGDGEGSEFGYIINSHMFVNSYSICDFIRGYMYGNGCGDGCGFANGYCK